MTRIMHQISPSPTQRLWHRIALQSRRIKRIVRAMPIALRIGGGWPGTLRRAWRLFCAEGVAGIRRGLLIAQSHEPAAAELPRQSYADWIHRYDSITGPLREQLRQRAATLSGKPTISVLMLVRNARADWLAAAIESVRRQVYPHLELCIADDASTDPGIRPLLERFAGADPRIKLVFRAENGNLSAAFNSVLALATGPWAARLDSEDMLPEHALFCVAEAINRRPEVRLIYSDEDKIDAAGQRFDPYFKCDWNVELFYSQDMIGHLGVHSTALLREIGGYRPGPEGAEDYDMALRCIERLAPAQIHHIPQVLYHRRAGHGSVADGLDAKPNAAPAGAWALNDHFRRQGMAARARVVAGANYKVDFPLPVLPPAAAPLATLIVPTRNGLALLRRCIESIVEKTSYPNYEILVVDNGSDDPATLRYLREIDGHRRIRVLRDDRAFNYSELNNTAVASAAGELLALVNNDVEVISRDWLDEMASHALRPGIGAVGARLLYPNDTVQHVGVVLGIGGGGGHVHRGIPRAAPGYFGRAILTHAVSAVTGACLVIRKSIYLEVGGLNETDLRIAFNDIDLCLRVRAAGYRNILAAGAELYHHESASRGLDNTEEKKARFGAEMLYMQRRWGTALTCDPAYSPNLSLIAENMSMAWPPRQGLAEMAG